MFSVKAFSTLFFRQPSVVDRKSKMPHLLFVEQDPPACRVGFEKSLSMLFLVPHKNRHQSYLTAPTSSNCWQVFSECKKSLVLDLKTFSKNTDGVSSRYSKKDVLQFINRLLTNCIFLGTFVKFS